MKLTTIEEKIIKQCQILNYKIQDKSISELADITFTTPSTISKLTRKLGYDSYTDFKEFYANTNTNNDIITPADFTCDYLPKISNSLSQIDVNSIQTLSKLIKESDEIFTFGIGSSLYASKYFNSNLIKMGYNAFSEDSFYNLSMRLNNKDDHKKSLLIIFSHTGETREILELLEADINKYILFSITSNPNSKLAKTSNHNIFYEDNNLENKKFSNTSMVLQVMITDLLLNELSNESRLLVKFNSQF